VLITLIEQGFVDCGQVATVGWSNGFSILSTSLPGHPTRIGIMLPRGPRATWKRITNGARGFFADSFVPPPIIFGKSPMEDRICISQNRHLRKMDQVKAPVLDFPPFPRHFCDT